MKFITFSIVAILLFVGCSNRKKYIIDNEKFVDILTEVHMADGVMAIKNLNDRALPNQSNQSYYNYIYKKYNVTKDQFDSTLFYYGRQPDAFKKISKLVKDRILAKIEETNKLKDTDSVKVAKDTCDIWEQKREWNLPNDGQTNPIPFKIYTEKAGYYVLSADISIYSDDRSRKLRMSIYAHYLDGTEDKQINGVMIKDGKYHYCSVAVLTDTIKKLQYVYGFVVDHSQGTTYKHIDIRNIKLRNEKKIEL